MKIIQLYDSKRICVTVMDVDVSIDTTQRLAVAMLKAVDGTAVTIKDGDPEGYFLWEYDMSKKRWRMNPHGRI